MKKFFGLFITLLLFAFIFSPVTNASTYNLKSSNLKLPNLYSTTVAQQLKSGTYKYYGIKLGMTKKSLYSTWGKPASADVSRGYGTTDGMYFYGNNWQTTVAASYPNTKASVENLIIDYISISDEYHKYELSQIKNVFGSPSSTYTSGKSKSYTYEPDDYDHSLDIDFKKIGTKWYVEGITFTKYNF